MTSDIREISPVRALDADVQVPPSKSFTNRALIVAALAEGTSLLINPSKSDDSRVLVEALRKLRVPINDIDGNLEITGTNGEFEPPTEELFVGNAGTALRFLVTFAGLAKGTTIVTGDEQMKLRPVKDLTEALRSAGIKCASSDGFPPVQVFGGKFNGGRIDVNGSVSSQFVSSLLLTSPYAKHTVTIHVRGQIRSMPYIDMSLYVMRSFGGVIGFIEPSIYQVSNIDRYVGREFTIEGDASSASYFLAAAAITGGKVFINNLSQDSLQGDIKFIGVLTQMGCRIVPHESAIEFLGGKLRGTDIDMNDMPDCVPSLAVVAAFAEGPTTISNIGHLRYKETNRLSSLAIELSKIGARVELFPEGMTIYPGTLCGATIESYNDHRMVMSFAVAGLRIPGIRIKNPSCVSKSFPGFWNEFAKLEQQRI